MHGRPKRIRTAAASAFVLCLLIFGFQNCSKGFQSASLTSNGQSSGSEGTSEIAGAVQAHVLTQDPLSDSGLSSLAFDADFTSYFHVAGLDHLRSSAYLSNQFASLDVDDAYPTQIASPQSNLMGNAADPEVAQANVYYHIDQLIGSAQTDSSFPTGFASVHVNTHCQTGANSQNNAYYDPSTHTECLGYAEVSGVKVWSALDSDVINHEFSHAFNHTFSTDDIMASTPDLGAMDEGFADTSAYLKNGNAYFGSWFGLAITESIFQGLEITGYHGLRDLTSVPKYPTYLVGEKHSDGLIWGSIFFELAQNGIANSALRSLMSHMLSDFQNGDTFANVVDYFQTEAATLGINSSLVQKILTERGLLRKDDVSSISVASNGVYVIDNHATSFQTGGNCNARLDAGESALVLVDLSNSSAQPLGVVTATLTTTAPTSEIVIPTGGNFGTYFKIDANSTYVKTAFPNGVSSTNDILNTVFPSFGIQATAAAHGTYPFTMKLTGFDTQDHSPTTANLTFSLTVGNASLNTGTNCTNGKDNDVWP